LVPSCPLSSFDKSYKSPTPTKKDAIHQHK
jgi:hypothetical protein